MNLSKFLMTAVMMSLLSLTACHKQSNNDSESEGSNTKEGSSKNVVEIIPQPANNGLVVFDLSHSTKGYLDGKASEFRGVIAQMGRSLCAKDYFLYGEKSQSIPEQDFFDTLNSGKFSWAKESDFINMIKFMVEKLQTNDIACLISDGIMSGTNEQIRISPNYNIQSREVLRNRLESSLEKLDSSYSALIVRYVAPFNGIYYCYDNTKQTLKCNRPYFAIIIGKWEKVKWIEQDLINGKEDRKDESFYQYTDLVMFGDEMSYNKCKFGAGGSGIGKVGNNYRTNSKDSIVFSCKIKDLQPYMQDGTYFNENFKIEKRRTLSEPNAIKEPLAYSLIPAEKYSFRIDKRSSKVVISFVNDGMSKIIDTYISKNTIRFSLKYATPDWTVMSSCEDDKGINNNYLKQNQTFNLKYLIDGFRVLNNSDYVIQNEMQFQ